MGVYVYGIRRADVGDMPTLEGVLDQPIYQVQAGPLTAMVSDCSIDVVRAERKHLSAHQRALATVSATTDLLPMAFGTVTPSRQFLETFLQEKSEVLSAQLARVAGAEEMALRLALDTADPMAYLVERFPELQAARAKLFGRRKPPSYDEKIRLGQLCDAVLREYRETIAGRVLGLLGSSCREVMALPARNDRELASWAILTPRGGHAAFEARIDDIAGECDDEIVFSVAGPWPPYNFVELTLQ